MTVFLSVNCLWYQYELMCSLCGLCAEYMGQCKLLPVLTGSVIFRVRITAGIRKALDLIIDQLELSPFKPKDMIMGTCWITNEEL
jgi:hypothetical protein